MSQQIAKWASKSLYNCSGCESTFKYQNYPIYIEVLFLCKSRISVDHNRGEYILPNYDTVCSIDFYPIKWLYTDYLSGVTFPAMNIGMALVPREDKPIYPCDLSCLSIDGINDTLLAKENESRIMMATLCQGYRCEH
jgi:hypothetical protein